ncbi:MAG: hypothetical protein AAF705_11755 [Bacteroidota bacterium]
MKELSALVEYANPNRLKRLAFFHRKSKKNKSQVQQLYQLVLDNPKLGDRELSQLLFDNPSDPRFYKVKHLLREQLTATVLLIEGWDRTNGEYQYQFAELRKQFSAAELLWTRGYPAAGVEMMKRICKQAVKLQMTNLIVMLTPYLKNYYVVYQQNGKLYQKYEAIYQEWIGVFNAEMHIKSIYEHLFYFNNVAKLHHQGIATEISLKLAEHESQFSPVDTANYCFFYAIVRMAAKAFSQQYQEAITVCWEAISALNNFENSPRGYKRSILLQVIGYAVRIEDFNEGKRAVDEALKTVVDGSLTYFQVYNFYLHLSILTGEFATAIEIANQMFKHPKFDELSLPYQEKWFLLRAYLYWLIKSNNVEDHGDTELHKFRLGRFINDVPIFAKDKQGMHIPVLVIQILWLIQRKKYLDARDRIKSLERYLNRHLRDAPGLKRTYYFVKGICQLANANFHKGAFARKVNLFLTKIEKFDQPNNQEAFEVEIIPYERFISYILNSLDHKMH